MNNGHIVTAARWIKAMSDQNNDFNNPVQQSLSCSSTARVHVIALLTIVGAAYFILFLTQIVLAFFQKKYAMEFGYWRIVICFFAVPIGLLIFVGVMENIAFSLCQRKTKCNKSTGRPTNSEET